MKKLGKFSLTASATAAIVVVTAGSAFATTIKDPVNAYSGAVRANNIGNITLSGTGSLGLVTNTCTGSQLDATVNSNGTGGSLTGVSITGCTNNRGGTTTVTALGLPYSGATVAYAPVAGGRDGTLTINAPNTAVNIQAVMTLPAWGISSLTCNYSLTSSTPLTINLYNYNNANKPVPSNTHAQGTLTGQSLQRTSTDVRCPSSAAATGKFQLLAQPSGHDLAVTS
ncbi:hypothetical protein [Actinomadura parmotrematis]|uniref:Tat pathway signal sequence domain protein n=1 Tax=Actinomadura parmotrematis TaxID=2864039 RepID=A0ABS7G5N8_9ACTN|nr:hypothetical protein [Actinomadura parmotrematis]MBW8487690.1 hypothetical protein [Actinomadura parmotrematis]